MDGVPIHNTESAIRSVLETYADFFRFKDEGLSQQMVTEWVKIEQHLDAELSDLSYFISEKAAKGEVITEQMLWKQEKYRRLVKQAQDQIDKYNAWAAGAVEAAQNSAYQLGIEAAGSYVKASYDSVGVSTPFWEHTDVKGTEAMYAATHGTNSPLRVLLKADYGEAVGGISSALIEGTARGLSPAQVAKMMVDGLGIGMDRSLLIAQTEMARAYRSGQYQEFKASSSVEYYVRFANKYTACLACLLLDGERYSMHEMMSDHPRGHCNMLAKVVGVPLPEWEHGKDYFEKLPEDKQREMMGNTRYEAWKSGKVQLSNLVTHTHSDEWGEAPAIKSLSKLGLVTVKQGSLSVEDLPKCRGVMFETEGCAPSFGKPLTKYENSNYRIWSKYSDRTPSTWKDNVVTTLTGRLENEYVEETWNYDKVNALVRQWAHTSNDNSPLSLRIQKAVSDEFGTPFNSWSQANYNRITQDSLKVINPQTASKFDISFEDIALSRNYTDEELRHFVREMYNETQEYFKSVGIDKLYVYRGAVVDDDAALAHKLIEAFDSNSATLIDLNPISSFSTSPTIAMRFAGGGLLDTGYTISTIVDTRSVIGFPGTGFGCLDEYEIVVISSGKDVVNIRSIGQNLRDIK